MVIGLGPKEPAFEGRLFSNWIWTMNESPEGPKKEEARAVVRELGHKHLSLLLRWLREEDHPSVVGRFDDVRHRVFFWLVRHKLLKNQSITSLQDFNPSHQGMAMWALPELEAADQRIAIPVLILMLGEKKPNQNEMTESAGAAWCVLSEMNPEAIQPLINDLTNQDIQTWTLASCALAKMGPSAKVAIPIFEKRLNDSDSNVRVTAAYCMGKLGGDPATFVPMVIQDLNRSDVGSLDCRLDILISYKEYATNALPVLAEMLNKSGSSTNVNDIVVRNSITNAIKKIRGDAGY